MGMTSPLQDPDIIASVLARLSSPHDILSASAVCRLWRIAATDRSHLRSWNLDDTLLDNSTLGTKTSSTPFLPKTPPPKQWINPTSFSPLASFKVPKSLLTHHTQRRKTRATFAHKKQFGFINKLNKIHCPYNEDAFFVNGDSDYDFDYGDDDSVHSPRTPSPTREIVKFPPLLDIVKEKTLMGAFLGDIDIISSRINDEIMQMVFARCPRLHTFRLVHLCPVKLNEYVAPFELFYIGNSDSQHGPSCKCSSLSNRAFSNIHEHCPQLTSVTLILQHLLFRKVLQKLLRQLGGLQNLHTLSIELRSPSFGQSTKSKVIWDSHVRFTEKEIMALILGGPPPLHALSLNRCDLTGASLNALASSCPNIEALELQSDFEDTKEPGFLQNAPLHLMALTSLSAAAFGVLMTIDSYTFKPWRMPCLKRLRLETRHALCNQHLYQIKLACPELESLHLIWHNVFPSGGMNEVHIYPFIKENIHKYSCSSCICNH